MFFPRLVWRLLSHFGRTRPDMAPGCAERFNFEFWRYAWRYRSDVLPRREARLAAVDIPVVRLRSPRETDAWLANGAPFEGAAGRPRLDQPCAP